MILLDSLSLEQVSWLRIYQKMAYCVPNPHHHKTHPLPQGRCCMQVHPSYPGTLRSLLLCTVYYHTPACRSKKYNELKVEDNRNILHCSVATAIADKPVLLL